MSILSEIEFCLPKHVVRTMRAHNWSALRIHTNFRRQLLNKEVVPNIILDVMAKYGFSEADVCVLVERFLVGKKIKPIGNTSQHCANCGEKLTTDFLSDQYGNYCPNENCEN